MSENEPRESVKKMENPRQSLLVPNNDFVSVMLEVPKNNVKRRSFGSSASIAILKDANAHAMSTSIPPQSSNIRGRFKALQSHRVYSKNYLEQLFKACRDGKNEQVREIIASQTDTCKVFNEVDREGMTLLHVAVRFNRYETVQLLIDCGANVNACQLNGVTPLHIAARYTMGDSDVLITPNNTNDQNTEVERKVGFSKLFANRKLRESNEPTQLETYSHQISSNQQQQQQQPPPPNINIITKTKLKNKQSSLEPTQKFVSITVGSTTTTTTTTTATNKDNKTTKETPLNRILSRSNSTSHVSNLIPTDNKDEIDYKSIILLLLLSKANVNAVDSNDSTPLHYASMRGNSLAVAELLSHPYVNIEAKDKMWMTPMHHAAEGDHIKVANILIQKGANIRCLDVAGMTPLHIAAEEGNFLFCQLLIDTSYGGANRSQVRVSTLCNSLNRNNETPLFFAASAGRADIISLLLENGSVITPVENSITTPIHLACASGSLETIKLLLNVNNTLIESRNCNDETPLHNAASLNKENIVKYFIEQGCDINCVDKDMETPLISAAKRDNQSIVKMLVDNGANVMCKDVNDYTCIHWCAINNSLHCAEYLMTLDQYSQSLQASIDEHENTSLHLAAQFGLYDMCQLLLHADSTELSMNAKNDQGYTPMLLAAKTGHQRVVELFLEISPALLMDNDDTDNAALHLSVAAGHVNIAKLLLQKGSYVDAKNSYQQTPLELAINSGNIKMTKTILNFDPLIDPSDRAHSSSLILACKLGFADIVNVLLECGSDAHRVDSYGRNCLDIAIDENQRLVAITLLKSVYWKDLLRNCSSSPDTTSYITSPMRKLIKKMPDVAELVFDQCITNNGLPENHPNYEIYLDYEFLEDIATEWGSNLPGSFMNKIINRSNHITTSKNTTTTTTTTGNNTGNINSNTNTSITNLMSNKLPRHYTTNQQQYQSTRLFVNQTIFSEGKISEKITLKNQFKRKCSSFFNRTDIRAESTTHPLLLMVKKERVVLLSHPLVAYLLRYKWKKFGRLLYYGRLFFFLVFLVLLTGYSLCTDSFTKEELVSPIPHEHTQRVSCHDKRLDMRHYAAGFFVKFGTLFLFIISMVNAIMRATMFVLEFHSISFTEVFDLIASCMSMYYVSGSFHVYGYTSIDTSFRCTPAFRSIGAIAVWMSYLSFVLFMRKLPKVGIYVVMYTDIFRTFMQFAPVYILIILSYGFSFFLLFQDRTDISAYKTSTRSIVKTLLGTVGEIEYDTFYNINETPPLKASWLLLIAFIVTNTLILMNLLVGLAVDDIQGVQSKAVLKRLALQVDLAMGIEFLLPLKVRLRSIHLEEKVKPNKNRTKWNFWSLWEFNIDESKTKLRGDRKLKDVASDNKPDKSTSKSLKLRLNKLENQCNRIEGMLSTLLEYQGLNTGGDSDRQPIVQ